MFLNTTSLNETALELKEDAKLGALLDDSIAKTIVRFKDQDLKTNEIAATAIVLSGSQSHRIASFRGAAAIYPASVVKLFYLQAAHQWMQDNRIADTAEL